MPVSAELIASVRSSPLLTGCSDDDLARLGNLLEEVDYPKGATIFAQDAEGGPLLVLVSGQVGIIRKKSDGKGEPKERLLAVIGAGECIGEMALADGSPRSASVVALDDVKGLRLAPETFSGLRESDPKLAISLTHGICRLLSKRIRQIDKSLEIVHYSIHA